jgi:uncharacterized protein (DUF2237 family)
MAITGATVARFIRHALGTDPSPEIDLFTIANQAGEFLTDAHNWRWKSRMPYTLVSVVGQDWFALPADFGEMIGRPKSIPGGTVYAVRTTTIEQISRVRQISPVGGAGSYFAALVYSARSLTTPPLPRLMIWPTPSVAENVASLYYRACWETLTADTTVVALPRYMEALYLQVARAWAQGYEDSDVEHSEERIRRIKQGDLWQACVARDSSEQSEYGPMDDGLAAATGELADPSWLNATIIPPS